MLVINEHILMVQTYVNSGGAIRKPLSMMSVIMDMESESITAEKGFVVVDATPDYFRDDVVYVLLYFEKLKVYIIRLYFTNPEINKKDKHEIVIVEEHLISPMFMKKNSFDPHMMK